MGRLREATADSNPARDVHRKLQENIQAQRKTIETERRALPQTIAKLSTEGRNLVETLGQAKGTAHRLLKERIEDIGEPPPEAPRGCQPAVTSNRNALIIQ